MGRTPRIPLKNRDLHEASGRISALPNQGKRADISSDLAMLRRRLGLPHEELDQLLATEHGMNVWMRENNAYGAQP